MPIVERQILWKNHRTERAKLPRHRLKKPIHNVKEEPSAPTPADRNQQEYIFASSLENYFYNSPSLLLGSSSGHHPMDDLLDRKTGGAYRDRTDDPLLAKQVLSQLS